MNALEWKATQSARAAVAAALRETHKHLIAVGDNFGKNDALNAAAKNIRTELKAAFPGVKFSVKSSRFSGGNSIDVYWTDGPCYEQVGPIINRYKAGSFDGMTDCYNYEHSAWCDAFGEAKYVFGHRNNSDRAIESAIRSTVAKYGSAAAVATVANFKSGALYDVSPIGNWGDDQYWSLQSLISRTLQTRCWKLTHA